MFTVNDNYGLWMNLLGKGRVRPLTALGFQCDVSDEPRQAEVIPLPGAQWKRHVNVLDAKLDDGAVRIKRGVRACEHRRSWVDERARTVCCRDCGVALDAIEVLTSVARAREGLVLDVSRLRSDRERLRADVDRLAREERNAKARAQAARRRALKVDHAALEAAAAECLGDLRGAMAYRPWEELSGPQQDAVVTYLARVVEAYAGALTEPAGESLVDVSPKAERSA